MFKFFIVYMGELNIKVLGIIFNVVFYFDDVEIKVSFVEGSVNVYIILDVKKNIFFFFDE